MFTLSKGHAVATLASIYAELGYFDRSILRNSRSYESILNGHPGPILPGIQIATGPMGQGFSVAQGFAIAGRTSPHFDSYAMTGDGELQEGPIWEAVMYAGSKQLDNLCLLVDQNNGQLDIASRMVFPMPRLESVFESFGWQAHSVDATHYGGVYAALEQFKFGPRNGKPTAIVCHSTKGHGAFSDFLNKHKVAVTDKLIEQELALQSDLRRSRVEELTGFYLNLERHPKGRQIQQTVLAAARQMHLATGRDSLGDLAPVVGPVLTKRAPARNKRIHYDASLLPRIDKSKEYSASDIVTGAMKIFARDTSRGVHRFGSGLDQRSRSRRRSRRSKAGVERRRRRSQHDGHRRGVCSPRSQRLDQHVLPLLRLEGIAQGRRRLSGTVRGNSIQNRLAQRGARSGFDDACYGTEFRDSNERRHAHGQRRHHCLRWHRSFEDHRYLLPATTAGCI